MVATAVGYVVNLNARLTHVEEWNGRHDIERSEAFRAFARAPREATTRREFTNTGNQGYWSDIVSCPAAHYVCGLRQLVDSTQQERTLYSGMNGIEFHCCPLAPEP